METKFEIIPIFPTPLWSEIIPSTYSNIVNLLYSEHVGISNINYGSRSKNSYVLNNPKYQNFSNYILNSIKKYGKEILGYDYNSYKFSQSWVSVKHPKESHITHIHPNSVISGVFYFGEHNDSTPGITFYKNLPDNHSNQHTIKLKHVQSPSRYSYNTFTVKPTPGTLLLFPSYLPHSVQENVSNSDRYSLAFNSLPTEGFGSEIDLTELKFN